MIPGTYAHLTSLGSILVKQGKVTADELQKGIAEQNRRVNGHKPQLGLILVEQGACSCADVDAAVEYQNTVTLSEDDGVLRAACLALDRQWAKVENALEDAMREKTQDFDLEALNA